MEPAIDTERLKRFEAVDLLSSKHDKNEDCRACIMEARAYVYRVDWTDHPPFDSPGITAYLISLNDNWPDKQRQRLKKYLSVPPTLRPVEIETRRAWMLIDWIYRVHQPIWYEAAGLEKEADGLRNLPEVTDEKTARDTRAARAALAARDTRAARAALAALAAYWNISFLVAFHAGEALGDATEADKRDAGIEAILAVAAKTRDAELELLDRMIAL